MSPSGSEGRSDLEARVQELEVLTGFQERLLAQVQGEVVAFTRRVERLELELKRLKEARHTDQEPFDEENDERVPTGG